MDKNSLPNQFDFQYRGQLDIIAAQGGEVPQAPTPTQEALGGVAMHTIELRDQEARTRVFAFDPTLARTETLPEDQVEAAPAEITDAVVVEEECTEDRSFGPSADNYIKMLARRHPELAEADIRYVFGRYVDNRVLDNRPQSVVDPETTREISAELRDGPNANPALLGVVNTIYNPKTRVASLFADHTRAL